MGKNTFDMFVKHCRTVAKAARILKTSHQNVSSMRNGRTWIKHSYAKRIANYLWEQIGHKVDPLDLVSPMERNELKSLSLPFTEHPIKLINTSISQVQYNFPKPDLNTKNLPLNQLRPIIVDETQQLIANPNTYWSYQQQNRKTVPAWQFSFSNLFAKKYAPIELVQIFLICERVAIGIAAKKYLGNRQGERSDLKLEQNFAQVKGKTDQFIASLLGLGSKENYRQSEKIQLLGSPELIQSVNEGTLKISTAARLTRFNHKHQKKILKLTKKQIFAIVYQSKKRRST